MHMTVRPSCEDDIPSIARVHVESWRTTYRGIVSDSFLAGLSYQKHEDRHRRYMAQPDTVHLVAESTRDGIVGFLMGGRERSGNIQYPGELYAIYILDQHRRHGVGSALIRQWAGDMRRAAINAALVWVLAENKSGIAFYERLGARYLREQMIEIGGTSLRELAYGWEDLSILPNPSL
jgi:ribosomal protein S18 acetylase RimI-like enzyme